MIQFFACIQFFLFSSFYITLLFQSKISMHAKKHTKIKINKERQKHPSLFNNLLVYLLSFLNNFNEKQTDINQSQSQDFDCQFNFFTFYFFLSLACLINNIVIFFFDFVQLLINITFIIDYLIDILFSYPYYYSLFKNFNSPNPSRFFNYLLHQNFIYSMMISLQLTIKQQLIITLILHQCSSRACPIYLSPHHANSKFKKQKNQQKNQREKKSKRKQRNKQIILLLFHSFIHLFRCQIFFIFIILKINKQTFFLLFIQFSFNYSLICSFIITQNI
ncbi:transmembrane protein, putative (macronuclear) [Tetrahymena thermophila SB210]|uniref:Transmembrane protein, putative n=1 Tax=Tetrahymena thermophila (strain SB210) TaxID=312017 RepID=W7XBD6_TETTS|nr:transmembrane protein, putative [Tetrahymena thermophila SB210]EWS76695.1 transmembrane protein, putative [Tetrahymena thermophila SB210]|eukprot:XP_012650765.1 transmembrane protein, putative [Tetrahymena thermophila SB210]